MTASRTPEELKNFLQRHLVYELGMLALLADYIEAATVDEALKSRPDEGVPARNAMIESFAVHFRLLMEFFYGERNSNFPNDVLASNYVDSWNPPARTQNLNRPNVKRVGTEIAHLSYDRTGISEETKNWDIGGIREDLGKVIRQFAGEVPAEYAYPEFEAQIGQVFPAAPAGGYAASTLIADATVMESAWFAGTATVGIKLEPES